MIKYINLISCFLTISLSFGSTLDGSDGRDKVVSILDNQNELKKNKLSNFNDRKKTEW